MKTLFLIWVLVASAASSSAQTPTIALTAKNTTPVGTKAYTMYLGASKLGTGGVDSALSEIEIPAIPLPSGIFYVWTVAPVEEEVWLSPRDLRFLAPGMTYREEYDIRVNWDGGSLKWTWLTPLPELVDSAWIVDGYTVFPDNIEKAKIVPNDSLTIDNPSITRFKLLVWFNTTTLSVREASQHRPSLFPTPCTSVLNVQTTSPLVTYAALDLQGRVLERGMASGNELQVRTEHLAIGSYVLLLTHVDGSTTRSQFIKH